MESVIILLKKHYNIIDIKDVEKHYYEGHKLKNACHITFDDGDLSFFSTVFPLLKKYNIPASIFVSPLMAISKKNFWFQEISGYNKDKLTQISKEMYYKEVNDNSPLNAFLKNMKLENIWKVISQYQEETNTKPKPSVNMSIEQLKELYNSGLVTIGAHTLNHPILKNENEDTASYEIKQSITQLQELLNTKITYFAFPNGVPDLDFTHRDIDLIKSNGIKLAFSTENKSFKPTSNPLSIPRRGISKGNPSFLMLKLLLGKNWDSFKRLAKGKQEVDFRIMLKNYNHQLGL